MNDDKRGRCQKMMPSDNELLKILAVVLLAYFGFAMASVLVLTVTQTADGD